MLNLGPLLFEEIGKLKLCMVDHLFFRKLSEFCVLHQVQVQSILKQLQVVSSDMKDEPK